MSRRALVTGSNGFVGRHAVDKLIRLGYIVDKIDLTTDPPTDCMAFFDLVASVHFYNVVIHAAGFVGGRAGIESRRTFLGAYNLRLDAALFEWALRALPRHLVYLSSSAVYPIALQNEHHVGDLLRESDVDPTHPKLPDATYGWVKLTGERLAAEYNEEAKGSRAHVVRPFSGYGADQDAQYPFGAFLQRASCRADPFTIWGSGQQVRDWVHIDDVMGAIMAVVEADLWEPVNVCTGIGTSMIELVNLFVGHVAYGYDPEFAIKSDLPHGVHHRVGDPTVLNEIYEPKITIANGVAMAMDALG